MECDVAGYDADDASPCTIQRCIGCFLATRKPDHAAQPTATATTTTTTTGVSQVNEQYQSESWPGMSAESSGDYAQAPISAFALPLRSRPLARSLPVLTLG